jgi:hypothetical protein
MEIYLLLFYFTNDEKPLHIWKLKAVTKRDDDKPALTLIMIKGKRHNTANIILINAIKIA